MSAISNAKQFVLPPLSLRRLGLSLSVFSMSTAGSVHTQTLPASESGSFRSDTVVLKYALDRPSGAGPFPVIVFVHGSGRTTRDEMSNLVPKFLDRGFAVFRYDKRGVGESGGTFRGVNAATSPTVIPELARDAAAAFATACSARGIDPHRCGFFGASQAGWIIPEAMHVSPNAAFAILFSGVAAPVGNEMFYERLAQQPTVSLDSAYRALPAFTGNSGYDPRATLALLQRPTLWLLGMQDQLIPNRLAVKQLDSLHSPRRPVVVITYPTYGHALGSDIWPDIDAFLKPFRNK